MSVGIARNPSPRPSPQGERGLLSAPRDRPEPSTPLGLNGLRESLGRALVALLVAPIRLYKLVLSPFLPRVCRFHPSCSVYAMGALKVHGPLKGAWLALRRLSRCHPFNAGGLDPVPPRDGQSAVVLLGAVDPFVASRLAEPPPLWLPGGAALVEHAAPIQADAPASSSPGSRPQPSPLAGSRSLKGP